MDDDDDGFRQFVDSRQRGLLRTAWALTGDWALAEDRVQTALTRTWPRWDRITRRDDPEVYVRRVMVNTWMTWSRRRWRGERPQPDLPDRAARVGHQVHCGLHPVNEVRAYSPAAHGGSLAAGRVLLTESSLKPRGTNLFDAFITPGGHALTALLNTCPKNGGRCAQSVVRITVDCTTGRAGTTCPPEPVLFRTHSGSASRGVRDRFLSPDPTGRYLIFDGQVGSHDRNGWISHEKLRPLAPASGASVGYEVW